MKVRTKLRPHQERVAKKFKASPKGLILYHKPGTGKTLSSINIVAQSGRHGEFIVPASLVNNIKKEIKKHTGSKKPNVRVRSYEGFTRHPDIKPGSIVVLDEAHRIRNPKSQAFKALQRVKGKAYKFLPMTGSAIYNDPHDLAPLLNLVSNKPSMPLDNKTFKAKYVGKVKVNPGLIGRLMGVKPKSKVDIKNVKALRKSLKGKIDYHDIPTDTQDFPKMTESIKNVPMTKRQHKLYRYAEKKLPFLSRYMIRRNLPLGKKDKVNLNAFLGMMRQVSNTPASYTKKTESALHAAEMSPKMKAILRSVKSNRRKNPVHKAIIYSNYLGSGLKPMSAFLTKHKIPHELFTGEVSKVKKKAIMSRYNNPRKQGLMLVSSSGTEGLDTVGTRSVHIMEPHWNLEKIRQVKARARRYKSHAHLPAKQRNVKVTQYHSVKPKTHMLGRLWRRITGTNKHKLIDEYMNTRSHDKDILNAKVLQSIKKVSK